STPGGRHRMTLSVSSESSWHVSPCGRVVETALGYFVNPLFTVLFGVIALRERLRRAQWIALGLAGVPGCGARAHGGPWPRAVAGARVGLDLLRLLLPAGRVT